MIEHVFGELTLDDANWFHWPCSCGVDASGRTIVDAIAGRAIHLRDVQMVAEVLR